MTRLKCGCVQWETKSGDMETSLCDEHQREYDAQGIRTQLIPLCRFSMLCSGNKALCGMCRCHTKDKKHEVRLVLTGTHALMVADHWVMNHKREG